MDGPAYTPAFGPAFGPDEQETDWLALSLASWSNHYAFATQQFHHLSAQYNATIAVHSALVSAHGLIVLFEREFHMQKDQYELRIKEQSEEIMRLREELKFRGKDGVDKN